MLRIKDGFIETLLKEAPLEGKRLLEIGSGFGRCTADLVRLCRTVVGVEPDLERVDAAQSRKIPRATFVQGCAGALPFREDCFDHTIFTLSLHHVPHTLMEGAIGEAASVTRDGGLIIFLEPGTSGSYYDAEILFDAGDGDERAEKAWAREAMFAHPRLVHRKEFVDEAVFHLSSVVDFRTALMPKKNLSQIAPFLAQVEYMLHAERTITIFQKQC